MPNNKVIGEFYSAAKEDTVIFPKEIPGYIAPEPQVLKEDGQEFTFVYTPIKYDITYDLKHGRIKGQKTSYTIEDENYYPPTPTRNGYIFDGWNPQYIPKGSIDKVKFTASWREKPILLPGKEINSMIDTFVGKENVISIQKSIYRPSGAFINLSSTSNQIIASFSSGVLLIFSEDQITCNKNMSSTFEGFSRLNDINFLSEWDCPEDTNISKMFKDCTSLSNTYPLNNWANGKFSNFEECFLGTTAQSANRLPLWYRWLVKIDYMSATGKVLESYNEYRVPNEVIYSKNIKGYTASTESISIDTPNKDYVFIYEPIRFNIRYNTYNGELINPKTSYTIEDETYIPAPAAKPGYMFMNWEPECIPSGSTGHVTFNAFYRKYSI